MFPSVLRHYKWTQKSLRVMIAVETAAPRGKSSVTSNVTRTLWSSLTAVWFHCLLQDSIVCKLVSYTQIKSSPWALALCQLAFPLSKAGLWVGVSAWLHIERAVSALSHLVSTDPSRNSNALCLRIASCRRDFVLYCTSVIGLSNFTSSHKDTWKLSLQSNL